jgi:hypothetical protein
MERDSRRRRATIRSAMALSRACGSAEASPSKRGVDLISDALPLGRLWYGESDALANAIGYAEHLGRSHHAVIRVYDQTGTVQTH